ncbi:MAG: carbamoyltransferase C-terminal domain-containing protein [Hyphomicrobium sp.]|nr:carbamoyltransferase C-terminal domain-containing protein [Hyphomicrobium sp.]
MNILGIVSKSHDTGAALLADGKPLWVLEEERFNRQKHTLEFPEHCLDTIFGDGRFKFSDVDIITMPWDMERLRPTFFRNVTAKLPDSLNLLWPSAHRVQASAIVNLPFRMWAGLGRRYGFTKVPRLVQVSHHDSHAAVFNVSPFEEAAVLVMDGYGDDTSTSGYVGRGTKLERIWQSHFFDSLGMLYTCVTEYLGFKVFEEGTVMALAACGGTTYDARFRDLITLLPDGQFRINRDYASFDTHGLVKPFKPKFYDVFGPARKRSHPLTDRHKDIAHALQVTIEETILHIVRDMEKRQTSRNLVISGGVGLNCVANARILRDTSFERVWVPPCASDTGAPLGSALWHWHQTLGKPRTFEMKHPFYGKGYSDAEITAALDKAGLTYERMEEGALLKRVAQNLADQKIVGWFQGRFEMGPRALGNRSILSDARDNRIKDLINAKIKHREAFRPFAPAVLWERAAEFFEITQPDPFMTLAPKIRPEKLHLIPAAAHVDGTGRIQTVERSENPRYYGVIEEYAKLTGIPVVLNTSFNRQEPVVNRPEEAISCFLRTDMDVLVLGDYYTTDRNPDAVAQARASFVNVPAAGST